MQGRMQRLLTRFIFTSAAIFAICISSTRARQPQDPASPQTVPQNVTPLLLAVHDAPMPFVGSDGSVHLVYELWMTNFSSADVVVERIELLGDGATLQILDAPAIARRLQPAGSRESISTLAKGTQALLFLHVTFAAGVAPPKQLVHRIAIRVNAAPPGKQEMSEIGGEVTVNRDAVVIIGPPLRGEGFISADSCCDASRHTRAALPVNGRLFIAQRYAVDWEQLDAGGRIYAGAKENLESYTIFGKPVLAVADAVVSSVTDGLSEQTPGAYPTDISLDAADGNAVTLDLGQRHFAIYAHMQAHSIKVHPGEHVRRGQVLGLVGNSGNSVAPHLHFQINDGPFSLGSNGLPYEIDDFQVLGKTPGTEAFDEAEGKGTPLAVIRFSPAMHVKNGLPLDQLVISFTPH
jgi:hypothetical protein